MNLDQLALDTAKKVEDLFAQHHDGGVGQRRARIQVLIRQALREAVASKSAWQDLQP